MRTWVNGELLSDPDAPAIAARDHGLERRILRCQSVGPLLQALDLLRTALHQRRRLVR